jgi:flavin reductase (DIM6/NTAB) family NADH-FMN oxidoreductase RutF
MLAISLGRRLGALKDTARNISNRREFVVNIANVGLLEALHKSGIEYPEEVSEVELLKLAVLPGEYVQTPRLAAAPVSMECVLYKSLELGATKAQLVIGEILLFHIRDDLTEDGKIDTKKLDPICRLAGPQYSALGKIFRMQGITG